MDYGEILSKAWKTTWKHKGLWILGILAGCSATGGGGSGGGSGTGFRQDMGSEEFGSLEYQFAHSPIIQWLSDIPVGVWIALAVGMFLFLITLAAVFWVLGSIGRSGLYAAFKQADETGTTTLKEAFSKALRNFWKILVIEVAIGIAGAILFFIIAAPLIGLSIITLGIGLLCLLPFFCLLIPISIAIQVFITLLEIAATADEIPLADTPGYTWRMIRKAPGDAIIITLLLGVISFIAAILIGLPILVVFAPVILGGVINPSELLLPGIAASVFLLLLYTPIAILLNGILQTYLTGSWTLFYQRLKEKPDQVNSTEVHENSEEK